MGLILGGADIAWIWIGHVALNDAIQEEKAFSEETSSLVNSAYSTLKSPLDRAIYLVRSAALLRELAPGLHGASVLSC